MPTADSELVARRLSLAASEMLIAVGPVAGGWSLTSPTLHAPLMFLSGGEAERTAARLAERIAPLGRWVRIEIRDGRGRLVGLRRAAPPQQLLRTAGDACATAHPVA